VFGEWYLCNLNEMTCYLSWNSDLGMMKKGVAAAAAKNVQFAQIVKSHYLTMMTRKKGWIDGWMKRVFCTIRMNKRDCRYYY